MKHKGLVVRFRDCYSKKRQHFEENFSIFVKERRL